MQTKPDRCSGRSQPNLVGLGPSTTEYADAYYTTLGTPMTTGGEHVKRAPCVRSTPHLSRGRSGTSQTRRQTLSISLNIDPHISSLVARRASKLLPHHSSAARPE